jgi:HAD superfamily hydrolase (TIGR01509 family)
MLRMMATRCDPPRDWEQLWAQYPAKKSLFRSRMLTAPPFPDTLRPLVEELHGLYRMAVVTSSGRDEVEPMLEAGGLRRYFDTLVCARDAARHKPAPDPYLLAAKLLDARKPLVIEDSEPGAAAGRAAGFEVLPVTNAGEVAELLRRRLSGTSAGSGSSLP